MEQPSKQVESSAGSSGEYNRTDNASKEATTQIARRPRGRPSRRDQPNISWAKVDHLLVYGDLKDRPDGQGAMIVYPSYRELAKSFGVSSSRISDYAQKHNVMRRREDVEVRTRARAEAKVLERRAEDLAVNKEDTLRLVDTALLRVRKHLEDDTFRCDTASDLSVLIKIKEILQGGADSRQESLVTFNLEDLQLRHRQLMHDYSASSEEERGEVKQIDQGSSETRVELSSQDPPDPLHPIKNSDGSVHLVGHIDGGQTDRGKVGGPGSSGRKEVAEEDGGEDVR